LDENKPIATSSLIFVATKKQPEKNHQVAIVNFAPYSSKKGESFKDYFSGKRKGKRKQILQSELLENVENWNYIKQTKSELRYVKKYNKNSASFSDYYTHTIAIKKFKSNFYFDGGYNIDERMILQEKSDYCYPKANNKYFTIKEISGYWQNIRTGDSVQKIGLRQGNQKYNLLDSKYKILWTHANAKRFFFTDKPVIWARNQFNAIGSDHKNEILFLFSLLNSPLSFSLLKKNLKSENEKNLDLAIKSIKQYIRIPKITTENQSIKDKIIELTEKMLALENVVLKDMVDFSDLTVQRFENMEVKGNNVVLTFNGKDYQQKIAKGKTDFVKKLIAEEFYDRNLIFNRKYVTLSELQNLEAINFEEQQQLKNHIDNLVFALYIEVEIAENQLDNFEFVQKDCEKDENYINQ
jgi:hypothetical protein